MRSMTWFVAAAVLLLLVLAGNVTPTLADTYIFVRTPGPPQEPYPFLIPDADVLEVSGDSAVATPDGYTRVTLDSLHRMGLLSPNEASEAAEDSGTAWPQRGGPDWLDADFQTLCDQSFQTLWADSDMMKSMVRCPKVHPFSGSTRISLLAQVPGSMPAPLRIYDVQGRLVRTLIVNRESQAVWDGRDHEGRLLPSGTYVVCCDFAGSQVTGRLVLQR